MSYKDKIIKLKCFLDEQELVPCELPNDLFELTGFRAKALLACRIREVVFSLLRRALIMYNPCLDTIIGVNAYGKILRGCNELFRKLSDLFELIRETDDSDFWIKVGLNSKGDFNGSLFHELAKALSDYDYDEEVILNLADKIMSVACEELRKVTKRVLSLYEIESKYDLPLLKGTDKQIKWARDIRCEQLTNKEISVRQANRILIAKTWIEKLQLTSLPLPRICYRNKETLKDQYSARWNHRKKTWLVPFKYYNDAVDFLNSEKY